MIDSIVLMTDERTRKCFEAMSAEDAGHILKGLLQHAAGEEIDDSDWSPLALAVYPLIEGQVDRMTQLRDKNRENGQKGGRPKTESKPNENPTETQTEPEAKRNKAPEPEPIPEPIPVPVIEKEEPSAPRKSAVRFIAPTADDVRSYAAEKGLRLDADRFVDFYASKGWRVGRDPMKDWLAAARNWAARDTQRGDPRNPPDKRRVDYDAAIREMYIREVSG